MASACSFFLSSFSSLFMASDSRYMHKKDCERAEIYTGLTTMLALLWFVSCLTPREHQMYKKNTHTHTSPRFGHLYTFACTYVCINSLALPFQINESSAARGALECLPASWALEQHFLSFEVATWRCGAAKYERANRSWECERGWELNDPFFCLPKQFICVTRTWYSNLTCRSFWRMFVYQNSKLWREIYAIFVKLWSSEDENWASIQNCFQSLYIFTWLVETHAHCQIIGNIHYINAVSILHSQSFSIKYCVEILMSLLSR